MFDRLLAVFLTLSALNYSSGIDLYIFADRFLMTGTICLLGLTIILCQPVRYLIPKWPVVLMLFCIWHFYSKPFHPLSQHAIFNIFFALIIFYLTCVYANDLRWTIGAITITCLLNIILAIGQFIKIDPIFINAGMPCGFLIDHQSLAGYIAISAPLFAYYFFGLPMFIPVLFCIFLNNYSAIFTNFISSLATILRRPYPQLFSIAMITFLIIATSIQNKCFALITKLKLRFDLWNKTAEAAFSAPLSGYGLGRFVEFGSKVDKISNINYFTAKSDIAEFMFEVGAVVGIGIITAITYLVIKRYIEAEKTMMLRVISSSILAIAIMMFCQSHIRHPKIAPTIMAILGWFYILTERKKEAKHVA